MERLQKYLSSCGVASRRKSEELILNGKVKVNGVVVRELGIKVSDNDIIMVNGVTLKKQEKEYYLLYKLAKLKIILTITQFFIEFALILKNKKYEKQQD